MHSPYTIRALLTGANARRVLLARRRSLHIRRLRPRSQARLRATVSEGTPNSTSRRRRGPSQFRAGIMTLSCRSQTLSIPLHLYSDTAISPPSPLNSSPREQGWNGDHLPPRLSLLALVALLALYALSARVSKHAARAGPGGLPFREEVSLRAPSDPPPALPASATTALSRGDCSPSRNSQGGGGVSGSAEELLR